jgi:hypothetical protein
VVRLNRLEANIFDHNERVERVFEGVEENFKGIGSELVPALKDLGIQFEASELKPYAAPFLQFEYLSATKS